MYTYILLHVHLVCMYGNSSWVDRQKRSFYLYLCVVWYDVKCVFLPFFLHFMVYGMHQLYVVIRFHSRLTATKIVRKDGIIVCWAKICARCARVDFEYLNHAQQEWKRQYAINITKKRQMNKTTKKAQRKWNGIFAMVDWW